MGFGPAGVAAGKRFMLALVGESPHCATVQVLRQQLGNLPLMGDTLPPEVRSPYFNLWGRLQELFTLV
jgi:hypothetical protein